MLGECGGQAGVGGGERGHGDQHRCYGANRVTVKKREGPANQAAELPSAAAGPGPAGP